MCSLAFSLWIYNACLCCSCCRFASPSDNTCFLRSVPLGFLAAVLAGCRRYAREKSVANNHVARLWQSGIQMRQVFEPDVPADVCVVASQQSRDAELSIVVRVSQRENGRMGEWEEKARALIPPRYHHSYTRCMDV